MEEIKRKGSHSSSLDEEIKRKGLQDSYSGNSEEETKKSGWRDNHSSISEEEIVARPTIRYFKCIDTDGTSNSGKYCGMTPKQACSKIFTKMVQEKRLAGLDIDDETQIMIQESDNDDQQIFGFVASRTKLDTPQELSIVDNATGQEKIITYLYRNTIKDIRPNIE